MEGILNVLKPPGMTSHDVISFLRRTLRERQIGHAGTLDPQAAGVLPVCVGRATRLVEYIGKAQKGYLAELTLGESTDTQDAWGLVLESAPVPALQEEEIKRVFRSFMGPQKQKVPDYSAVKISGRPRYEAARKGVALEELWRPIEIFDLDFLEMNQKKVRFFTSCSQGTYVRALCHDLAEALGTKGHMSFLLRTHVGAFSLEEACTLEEITEKKEVLLMPLAKAVEDLQSLVLDEEEASRVRHGQTLVLSRIRFAVDDSPVACYNQVGQLLAVGHLFDSSREEMINLKPQKVFL